MKSITNRLFLFAVAALSLGTVAYGQNPMSADVPFAFAVQGTAVKPAGHYTIRLEDHGNGPIAQVRDRDTGRGVFSLATPLGNKVGAAIAPHLVFRCTEAGCRLAEVWTSEGGYGIPVRHVREREFLASIKLVGSQN